MKKIPKVKVNWSMKVKEKYNEISNRETLRKKSSPVTIQLKRAVCIGAVAQNILKNSSS